MRILLLAGTAEARDLSQQLDAAGIDLVTSLAGTTDRPAPQGGRMRRGGFGGIEGLTAYIRAEAITHIIDATHPFAAQMSAHAAQAAEATETPIVQLVRPAWPDKTSWTVVDDLAAAAGQLSPGARVFLSTGRNSLGHFEHRPDVHFLVRVIDNRPGDFPLQQGAFLIGKPPFSIEEEMATMKNNRIDTLVSRNSGGTGGIEKLLAAERLNLSIIMARRPDLPDIARVETVDDALKWVKTQ